MAIGHSTEKFRLLANGVQFHELDHETMCAASIGLSKVLLRPGLNTIIDKDHHCLWSWCGELLLSPRAQFFPRDQYQIKSLFETTLHAALANCRRPNSSEVEWQEQNRINGLQPHHAKQLLLKSSTVLSYLAFPVLEATLKRACSAYVSLDGVVNSSFDVPNKQGGTKKYKPKNRCNSLRDLLFLHHTKIAGAKLKALLDQFRDHIALLNGTQDPFDLIYSWRNDSLHGSTNFQTIGGTILNLALLISLFEIEQDFEDRRLAALEHCRREAQSTHKSPWSFYPPY
jgi:hypothetical protein